MKTKIFLALTILVTLFILVACSQTSSGTGTTKSGTTGTTQILSAQAELLVGTFKLEDTDLTITADQAKLLLPLWQTLQSLSTSSTAATEEVNAVVDQIKSTMTAQQIARITAMKLTQQDMMSVMSMAGVSPNGASTTATPMARGNGGIPGGGQAGGGPSGGMPPGGGGVPGGGAPSGGMPDGGDPGLMGGPDGASSTPQTNRPAGMGNQLPPPLLNALIQLLQKKIK